jgi:nitrite reductase (NADH) large subunit
MAPRLLVIGNGMACVRLIEALTRSGASRFSIAVVGAEPDAGYNRVLLSALLAGDVARADIELRGRDWYAARGIRLITGDAVVAVDTAGRKATLASGLVIDFDVCVFATGSEAFRLPIPGIDRPGVMTFRDLGDVARMEQAAEAGARIAIIGGGLLGIEAAYGLAKLGADVTLVHVMDRLMERQLDGPAAKLLKRAIERLGVKVLLQRQTLEVIGDDPDSKTSSIGLRFADGSELAADLVICAVGIKPQAVLAKEAGLATARGIIVNDQMAASVSDFYAIGECAEHRGTAYGLVEPAYAQAEALAKHLHGEAARFEGMVLATNLKVSGVPVFSAGNFIGGDGTTSATLEDSDLGIYRKLIFEGERLIGCVLVGEAEDGLWYLDLIRQGTDIRAARHDLLHGRTFAETLLAVPAEQKLAEAA